MLNQLNPFNQMRNVTKFLFAFILLAGFMACNDSENVEPTLTVEEKFQAFADDLNNVESDYSDNEFDNQILLAGSKHFDSIKPNNQQLEDDSNARTESGDSYIIEIDGELYLAWWEDGCISYGKIVTPGSGGDFYFSTVC